MTSRYENRQEIADKADWEGGVSDLVFGYGLTVDELPEGDTELRDALTYLLAMKMALERFEALLPEPYDD